MDILRIFAKNVKKYRLGCGYSQEMLAEYSGLHRTYISAVERSRRSIALENVQKIANALNIETHLLFVNNQVEEGDDDGLLPE